MVISGEVVVGTLLVVDGSDICRAPIVACTLQDRLAGSSWAGGTAIASRGLAAEAGRTMCESAAARLGFTGPAIAFYGAHRAAPLTVADLAGADLVLTAERAQRSAVVRMLPGTQATVFTWKEALVLASVLVDRRRISALSAPADLPALARALHGARGTVPLDRAAGPDRRLPLAPGRGGGSADHRERARRAGGASAGHAGDGRRRRRPRYADRAADPGAGARDRLRAPRASRPTGPPSGLTVSRCGSAAGRRVACRGW